MYANSLHEKLLLRPAFLSRQKTTKTPLVALQEQSQLTSRNESPRDYVLPEIGIQYLHDPLTLPVAADAPSPPRLKPAQPVKAKVKAKSVQKPKPIFQFPSTALATHPIPLQPIPSTTKDASSSQFKFRFAEKANVKTIPPKRTPTQAVRQVVDAVRSPSQKVRQVVEAVMDKEGAQEKMVCGLPCNSRRREKELTYTLEILTGMRVRKADKETEEKGFKIGGKRQGTKRVARKKSYKTLQAM